MASLNAAVVKVGNTPEMTHSLAAAGLERRTSTPKQFAAFIRNEYEQNIKLVKSTGLKIE